MNEWQYECHQGAGRRRCKLHFECDGREDKVYKERKIAAFPFRMNERSAELRKVLLVPFVVCKLLIGVAGRRLHIYERDDILIPTLLRVASIHPPVLVASICRCATLLVTRNAHLHERSISRNNLPSSYPAGNLRSASNSQRKNALQNGAPDSLLKYLHDFHLVFSFQVDETVPSSFKMSFLKKLSFGNE